MRELEIINATLPYHVSYRIKGVGTSKGSSKERYTDLIARLEKLRPVIRSGHFEDEAHTATSSWIVHSSDKAPELVRKLGANLTAGIDLLEVVQVDLTNFDKLTKEAPKPTPKKT
jgi:hypothetical protein